MLPQQALSNKFLIQQLAGWGTLGLACWCKRGSAVQMAKVRYRPVPQW